MNSLFSNAIARVTSFVKTLRLKQVIVVSLVGLLVITSTGCASGVNAAAPRDDVSGRSYNSPYDKNDGPTRELYKPTQKREGYFNNYNDDLKYDRDDVKANAEKRVQQAAENLDKNQAHNPKEVFSNIKNRNPLDDKAQETADSISDSTKKLVNDFSEGTRKGTQNVKENVDRAADAAPRIANEAKRNAQGAANDVLEGAGVVVKGGQKAASRAGQEAQDRM